MARNLSSYPPTKYSVTRLGGGKTGLGFAYPGGLDLITPSLALQPGSLRAAQNFECAISGGYSRIAGYERVDGHAAPSAAVYSIIQFNGFTTIPLVGDSLSQATSSASGKVVFVNNVMGATYVALTQVSGAFDTTHLVSDGGNPVGIPIPQTAMITSKQSAQYTAAAADVYRALISAVPGSGPVLDCFHLISSNNVDHVYAFRANVGNTAVLLWKASASGWISVPLYSSVAFTIASQLPIVGDTLTQGGVTATVQKVLWSSGATGSTTAAGTMVISSVAGGHFTSGAATSTSGGALSLSGAESQIVILPGGTWEHTKCNFTGAAGSRRVYGCDGVNKGYEFDGSIYAPIPTGANPDTPRHVTNHKNYLVFATLGSIMGSGPGLPYKWNALDGAWEIATNDIVTGMVTVPGAQTTATLAVYQKTNTSFLYGTDPTTFNYVTFNTGIGALSGSVQSLFDMFVFDSLGILTVQTTLNFGNFSSSTLTKNILPFIIQERTKIATSIVNKTKSQYRVFFNDGYGLYLTMVNQQYLGAMPVQFPNPIGCIDVDDQINGNEVTYFGSSDSSGYVYQLDVGTSFDGVDIGAYITLAWDPIKSPRVRKRFRAASIEMQGTGYAEVSFGYSLDYGNARTSQPTAVTLASAFASAPNWDAFTWDNFVWDGQTLSPSDITLGGTSENIQVTIASGGNYISPYTINSVIYHYTPRRGMRV